MRPRKEIELDGTRKDVLALEVLLDIRELLKKRSLGGGLKTPTKK